MALCVETKCRPHSLTALPVLECGYNIAGLITQPSMGSARTLPVRPFERITMPYKNKADANAAARRRWANDPEVRRRGKEATANWEEDNKEERNSYRTDWATRDRLARPEFYRAREFAREMKKYNTTVEWYRDKLIEQCGVCAICKHLSHHHGTIQRLQVDHKHACCDLKTKSCGQCLRGLLCADCNMHLSYLEKFLKDVTTIVPKWDTWLENALLYLTRYGSR